MNYHKIIKTSFDWLVNIFLAVFGVAALWFLAQLFIYASFTIPTDSMEPTIIPGDRIYVDKTYMGARLFDIIGAAGGKKVDIYRSPGRNSLRQGDVMVFNFPYKTRWDSIALNVRVYYVKRCIGVPGDTVEIHDCSYYTNGKAVAGIAEKAADRLRAYFERYDSARSDFPHPLVVEMAFPNDSAVPWTVREFGPLIVPEKGHRIQMDSTSAIVYRNYIEWETGEKLSVNGDSVRLGGMPLNEYVFKENYYFAGGDNSFNSQDSRYFGLVPEPFVVGKASFIWKSVDKHTGRERKERKYKSL